MTGGWLAAALVLLVTVPAMARAQEEPQEPRGVEELDLPPHVADEVVDFFNDPTTIRFNGRSSVPEGREIVGDVGVLGGPFTVAGRIRGSVIVVNGDLRFRPGGEIVGDVTVIGGQILPGPDVGTITGAIAVYDEALRYRERGGRISIREGDDRSPGLRWGRARITVRSAGSYNRVEGLPVLFGPTFRTADPDPFLIEGLALWRTEAGLTLDEEHLGYAVRAEQRMGRRPLFAVGAGAHSRVSPIADWGLTSVESSLSTFLLHKDYRDYYEREGWSAWARIEGDRVPLSLEVEYRDENHAFAPVSSPWTLRKNDDPWRPQPLVAEGDIRTVIGTLVYDDRNDRDDPTDGWYGQLRVTRGVSGDLRTVEHFTEDPLVVYEPEPVDHDVAVGFLDLRRYNRVTPDSDLSFRFLFGGSLDGSPLPPQFQQALGGEGSLPGHGLFVGDCGARDETYLAQRVAFDDEEEPRHPVFRSYGCDRAVLFQLEYRANFDVSVDLGPDDDDDWDEEWDWYPVVDLTPSWAFFFNAGRGWSESDEALDTGTLADVGLGVFLGDIGLYWAYPLEGEDRGVNFFIRLNRRF